MTLWTLTLAWAAVVPAFLVGGWLAGGAGREMGRRRLTAAAGLVLTAEALVVTLLGALWFASLGAGGWWLVFGLVGLLVAGAERGLRSAFLRSWGRGDTLAVAAALARYLVAGGLLAWLLR